MIVFRWSKTWKWWALFLSLCPGRGPALELDGATDKLLSLLHSRLEQTNLLLTGVPGLQELRSSPARPWGCTQSRNHLGHSDYHLHRGLTGTLLGA